MSGHRDSNAHTGASRATGITSGSDSYRWAALVARHPASPAEARIQAEELCYCTSFWCSCHRNRGLVHSVLKLAAVEMHSTVQVSDESRWRTGMITADKEEQCKRKK